jgi:hypothetical protein
MSAQRQTERHPTQRYTIELSPEYQQVIADLMSATKLRTQKDLFENSIALMAWAVREVARGRLITSFDEDSKTYAELQMPALMSVGVRQAA